VLLIIALLCRTREESYRLLKNRKNTNAVSAEVEFAEIDPLNEVLLIPELLDRYCVQACTVNVSLSERDVTSTIRKPVVFQKIADGPNGPLPPPFLHPPYRNDQ